MSMTSVIPLSTLPVNPGARHARATRKPHLTRWFATLLVEFRFRCALSEILRRRGLAARMLGRLDDAHRVLLIYTPTYDRRFRGH